MYEQIFKGLLCLLIAPALGALLMPEVAKWFGQTLINHARGMRALYPGLALAAKEYKEQRRYSKVGFSIPDSGSYTFIGTVENIHLAPEMDEAIHRHLRKSEYELNDHLS